MDSHASRPQYLLPNLDVTSSYRKLIESIDTSKPMRDLLANLDVTSSYRELIKSIDTRFDGAHIQSDLVQRYVEALGEVDEPGSVTGLEQALIHLNEVPESRGGLGEAARAAIAVYLALLAFALCAGFYLHHPDAAHVILDASTPATWA
jgi:hypothetical protein